MTLTLLATTDLYSASIASSSCHSGCCFATSPKASSIWLRLKLKLGASFFSMRNFSLCATSNCGTHLLLACVEYLMSPGVGPSRALASSAVVPAKRALAAMLRQVEKLVSDA